MEAFSALLALCEGNSPVTGEFPTQRPVTRSLDVSFDLHLNKRLSKQSWGWRFETSSRPLWRHCNRASQSQGLSNWLSLQRLVTQSFDVLFHLRLNKRLSRPTRRRWFETPSRLIWRHRNGFFQQRNVSPTQFNYLEYSCGSYLAAIWDLANGVLRTITHSAQSKVVYFLECNSEMHVVPTFRGVIERKNFPRYWPFVRGFHRSPMDSSLRQRFFVVSLSKLLNKHSISL